MISTVSMIMLLLLLLLALVLACAGRVGLAAERRVPAMPAAGERIRVVIDSDAACEVDDQYAIALALLSPERFEIEGFVAAHFGDAGGPEGIDKSFREIETVLAKAGMKGKFPVKRGAHPFRYSQVPVESEGVDFLIERALAGDGNRPLWVISLGACTDIASAILKAPRIKQRVVAFWHGRTQWPDKAWNFNAYNDLKAVRILFASDVPFILFDTGTHLTCPMAECRRQIRPHGPLGRYLHDIRLRGKWYQSPKKGFYDLGDVAALVDPSLVKQEVVPAPGVNWDMLYDHKKTHRRMLRLHSIDRGLRGRREGVTAPPARQWNSAHGGTGQVTELPSRRQQKTHLAEPLVSA